MEVYFFNKRTRKFSESLDKTLQAPVEAYFNLLSKEGYLLEMPHSRALGGGLFELRVINLVHVRFCYAFHEGAVWLLHGFIKKTDKIPMGDMEYARKQLRDLLQSK